MEPKEAPAWFRHVIMHGGKMLAPAVDPVPGTATTGDAIALDGAKDYGYPSVYEPYRPYGGATTFAAMDSWTELQKVEYEVSDLFWTYRSLFENIMCDPELTPQQKAAQVLTLTNEFSARLEGAGAKEWAAQGEKAGRRVNKGIRAQLSDLVKSLVGVKKWADYDDAPDEVADETKESTPEVIDGFKLIDGPEGTRWVAFSSNAFEDNDKEIFSTAALEDAVRAADEGEFPRGPLRIFHVEGADIGDADFQAVIGRVLFESGTFRDDEYGQKALSYLREHPEEEWMMSIGYKYLKGDDKDGVYDWMRIKERSILPAGKAANSFTTFAVREDEEGIKMLNQDKLDTMGKLLGADLAAGIVARAESSTKALEESGVGYKESTPSDLATALRALPELPESVKSLLDKHAPVVEATKEPAATAEATPAASGSAPAASGGDDLVAIKEALMPMAQAILKIGEDVKSISDWKTSIETAASEKSSREANAPKGGAPQGEGYKASTAGDSQLDPTLVAALLGRQKEGNTPVPTNPAAPYVTDLVGANAFGQN